MHARRNACLGHMIAARLERTGCIDQHVRPKSGENRTQIALSIHGDGRKPRIPVAAGTRASDTSAGNENVMSGLFQPAGDALAEAAIAAEDENAHQARSEKPSGRSGDPIRPLTMAAWIVVAGHSFEIGPTSRSRMKGRTRLSD